MRSDEEWQSYSGPVEISLALQEQSKDSRERLLRDKELPAAVVDVLVRDPEQIVRQLSAHHPNATREAVQWVAGDPWRYNRFSAGIALEKRGWPNDPLIAPKHAVASAMDYQAILDDPDPIRRGWALRGAVAEPAVWATIVKRCHCAQLKTVEWAVLESQYLPDETLELLSRSRHFLVRKVVADRDNTPPSILEALSTDVRGTVRISVGENPNTPREVLRALTKDPTPGGESAAVFTLYDLGETEYMEPYEERMDMPWRMRDEFRERMGQFRIACAWLLRKAFKR